MKASKITDATRLESIPNIGPMIAAKLRVLGFVSPCELVGQDAYEMYDNLREITGEHLDPCLLDVFISAVSFANGAPPKPWWKFTEQRKAELRRQAKHEATTR